MDGTMAVANGAGLHETKSSMPWTTQAQAPAEETAASNPLAPLIRAMRGRWFVWLALSAILGGALGAIGFMTGTKIYQTQAVLRVYPKETGILYNSRDDSVLKTFDSFVKAETAFANSPDVMARAVETLKVDFPDLTEDMVVSDLRQSVAVKRSDTLIVLDTSSKDPAFAAAKLNAVTGAYLALKTEADGRQMNLRSGELVRREAELLENLREIDRRILEIGKEYGSIAIAKAHVEKIAQIDALATRRSDVERTLAAMRQNDGAASADMNDEHILRATLLDRGLADINIELARNGAELATLLERYTEGSRQVRDKRAQIEILEQAMADRRNQIQVLGQTGALTDQSDAGQEDTLQTIATLLEKVTGELEEARLEARALNAQRVELAFLEEERSEMRRMLDDTRTALDVIRIESRKTNPGLTDVMSPAVVPVDAADDSSKMQAALGVVGGGMIATFLVLGAGLSDRRLRWSDDLKIADHGLELLSVERCNPESDTTSFAPEIDRLRTALQLVPSRGMADPMAEPAGRTLAIVRAAPGGAGGLAGALAQSFAKTDLSVALVRTSASSLATFADHPETTADGSGATFTDLSLNAENSAWETEMSLPTLRRQIAELADRFDVILLDCGSIVDTVNASLVASASDYTVAEVRRGDDKRVANACLDRLSSRSLHGAGIAFSNAQRVDPGLPVHVG